MKSILALLVAASAASAAAPPDARSYAIRRGIDRLQAGAAKYTHNRQCFSCHHQALTVAALMAACTLCEWITTPISIRGRPKMRSKVNSRPVWLSRGHREQPLGQLPDSLLRRQPGESLLDFRP